jgi:hypothetical protein
VGPGLHCHTVEWGDSRLSTLETWGIMLALKWASSTVYLRRMAYSQARPGPSISVAELDDMVSWDPGFTSTFPSEVSCFADHAAIS